MKIRNDGKREKGRPRKGKVDLTTPEGIELKSILWEAIRGNPIGDGELILNATAWVNLVELMIDRGFVEIEEEKNILLNEINNEIQIELPFN